MKKLLSLFLMAVCCVAGYAQTVIDSRLNKEMALRNDDEQIKVIVIMKSQYDRTELCRRADNFVRRADRREFVVNELKAFAEASQYDLKCVLAEMKNNDLVSSPTTLWMSNALYFYANKSVIRDLAKRNDIEIIGFAEEHYCLFDEEARPASSTREITQNVFQVHANEVWELGFTGEGVVVAVIDTGVNYNHLDLADHLWDGGAEFPHHGYDVKNNDNDPMDDHGHGSHCSGTVCGDGTAGSQTGMAPDATLMCVKCLDSGGSGGAESISQGIQWAVEHGCDMFSMSLGIANSSVAERTLLRNTCVAALDAGVVGAIAAGNEGDSQWQFPIPNNVRVPGSCPPPYMDPDQSENPGNLSCSVSVGAVDYNDVAAYFTSHGPVTWTNTEFGDYPYNPGIGLIRPDVCAPGVDIKSLNYSSNTGYTFMSGTSMATPCVAGCMALLLSKNDMLTPAEVCQVLEETALPLSTGKSNITGYGRVDVLAAIEAVQLGALTMESFVINDVTGNNDHKLNPGESVTLDLALTNVTEEAVGAVTVYLSTDSDKVTITDNVAQFSGFSPYQTVSLENAFAFEVSEDMVAKQKIKFYCEIYSGDEMVGRISFNVFVYDYLFSFGGVVVLNDDNNNGLLEPGETANLRIFVDNLGNELASMLVGTLGSNYSYVTLNETEKPFGTIGAGLMGYADYSVTLSSAATSDFVIPFTLNLVDAAGRSTELSFEYRNACNIVFSLHDSYGDGWNGAYISVTYSDGTPSEQMTISSGNSATYVRELASNSTVTLNWHNGSWDSECSFEVMYENGSVIYQNNNGTGLPQSFVVNCSGAGGSVDFCQPVQNLSIVVDQSDVVLTWDAPSQGNPVEYEVWRETVFVGSTIGLTLTDSEVPEGIYNYCVYAAYDNCQSEFVCETVEVSSCPGVRNLDYTLDDSLQLTLTWEAPEELDGLIEYQIYKDGELLVTTNELSYSTQLSIGQYDFSVRTIYEECEKDVHAAVCILDAVTNLHYVGAGHHVDVAWDMMVGVSQYEVYINGEWVATVNEAHYAAEFEQGLTTVTVKPAANGCYVFGASIEVCVCESVTDLHVTEVSTEGFNVGWSYSSMSLVDRFDVYVNGEYFTSCTDTLINTPVVPVIGENEVCVVAKSIYGCASEQVCVVVNVCETVHTSDMSFVGNEVTIAWDDVAESYYVWVDADGPGLVLQENTFSITLENGHHHINVRPIYEDCITLFADFDFMVTNIPPEIHFTDVHEGLMATEWTPVDDAVAYNLYRDGELIAENLVGTAYNDNEMVIDTVHCYAVSSVFPNGVSDLSEEVCAKYYTGLGEMGSSVGVYPNPTRDKVTIECKGMSLVEVYSVDGKLIDRIKTENDVMELGGLENGVYLVRILKGDEVVLRRIVKL